MWCYIALHFLVLVFLKIQYYDKLQQKIVELESDLYDCTSAYNCAVKGGTVSVLDLKHENANLKHENGNLKREIERLKIACGYMRRENQDLDDKISLIKNLSEIFYGKSV